MTDESKTVRLNKIAREFNLGVSTIVEFLGSKGIAVENNANAKVDMEAYALLRSNFQGEKEAKEKAISSTRALAGRESVTIDSSRRKGDDSGSGVIDLSMFQKSSQQPVVERIVAAPAVKPAPVAPVAPAPVAVAEEPAPAPAPVAAPPVEAPAAPVAAAAPEVVAPVVAEAPEAPAAPAAPDSRVKVVGKVDLEGLAPKKKAPAAKAPAPAPAQPATKAQPEPQPQPQPEPAPQSVAPQPQSPPAPEFMRAQVEKLTGPTVLGRIELPVERKRTPGGASAEEKRKRKRITKVDVVKTAASVAVHKVRARAVDQATAQEEVSRTAPARVLGGTSPGRKSRRRTSKKKSRTPLRV